MNWILVIVIACALAYALGYRLGVLRGKKESRMREYREGFRKGYDRARKDLSELFRLKDEDILQRIRELRRTTAE